MILVKKNDDVYSYPDIYQFAKTESEKASDVNSLKVRRIDDVYSELLEKGYTDDSKAMFHLKIDTLHDTDFVIVAHYPNEDEEYVISHFDDDFEGDDELTERSDNIESYVLAAMEYIQKNAGTVPFKWYQYDTNGEFNTDHLSEFFHYTIQDGVEAWLFPQLLKHYDLQTLFTDFLRIEDPGWYFVAPDVDAHKLCLSNVEKMTQWLVEQEGFLQVFDNINLENILDERYPYFAHAVDYVKANRPDVSPKNSNRKPNKLKK